jgi:hypothetical protein
MLCAIDSGVHCIGLLKQAIAALYLCCLQQGRLHPQSAKLAHSHFIMLVLVVTN